MRLTLAQLRYVVAVAREGSVTGAARSSGVSQPSVSVAIDQVETLFGQRIFVRHRGSGIALTSFGRLVISKARHVLVEADELAALGDPASQIAGELILGSSGDLAPHFGPALIHSFAEHHARSSISLSEETFESLGRRLEDQSIDLGLTFDVGLPMGVKRIVLHRLRPYALVAATHALAAQKGVRLADLARYPLIASDQPHSWQHTMELFRARGLTPATGSRVKSFELLRSIVAHGRGVAVCYARPYGQHSYDGFPLVCRPISDRLPSQHIVLAHLEQKPLSKVALAFIAEAESWFDSHAVFAD